jgi:colanic acid/amylovoran biosynthesis glycosyltransferase
MRVAYVIPAWPPVASQPFVVNEMVEVQAAGHELVVLPLYRDDQSGVRHGTYDQLHPVAIVLPELFSVRIAAYALGTVLRHPLRTLGVLARAHGAAGTNPWAHLRVLAILPKALAAAWILPRLGVDRLHAHFASNTAECAAVAGVVASLPYSFTAHAYDIYLRTPRHRNDTLSWKVRAAALVVGISDYGAQRLRAFLAPPERGRVHTVHVGIPMHLFRPSPAAPDDGTVRLLCVARYCEKKGIDTLIDACGVLRERGVPFTLRVFGDGPLRPDFAAQIERLGLRDRVALGGPIPQEQVAAEMRACHAFVMPCREEPNGDMDGIPTVFMEAMASGRPVISSALSGIPELVQDGVTGLVVPPDDPAALADAITRLAADAHLRVRLAAAGRTLVERQHDQARNARRLIALWEAAAAPRT